MILFLSSLLPFLGASIQIWIIACVIAALVYFYYAVKKRQSFWEKTGIKCMKPTFFLGNIEIFRSESIPERVITIYNEFPEERYHGAYQFILPTLIVKDPDLIKSITVKDFDHFVNRRDFGDADWDPLWNRNLVAIRNEKWRDVRSTLSPSFTSSKMKIMFSLIDEIAKQFVEYHQQQNEEVVELEMKDVFSRYSNDVIASTAFGLDVNSLKDRDNEFFEMGKKASNFGGLVFIKFFMHGLCPTISKLLKIAIVPKYIQKYFSTIIEDTIKTRKEKNIVRPDMIHLLLEAQKGRQDQSDESSSSELTKNRKLEITDQDIIAQAFLFFVAGFDTVSTHISFTFYELAVNPSIQNRLRDEINTVKDKITYETLLGLKYLDMVVSESLRKWPPSVVTEREVSKEFTIQPVKPHEKPLVLEKGVIISIPVYALHRDPKFYPEPENFNPQRFSDENKHQINGATYSPFGAGPRSCIGSRFALLESKLILFHVLKSFEVVPVDRTRIPLVLDKEHLNLAAAGGIWLGLKRVEDK